MLDANMPRSALSVISAHGHRVDHVKDFGMWGDTDQRIAEWANTEGAALITRDLDFADVRSYPPESSAGFLVLRVPDNWTAPRIAKLLDRFFGMTDLVAQIPGHLVILDPQQARYRPALEQTSS